MKSIEQIWNNSSARNIYQQQNLLNDEQQELIRLNPNNIRRLDNLFEYVKFLNNARDNDNQYDTMEKRARAIVKGDPREFMG